MVNEVHILNFLNKLASGRWTLKILKFLNFGNSCQNYRVLVFAIFTRYSLLKFNFLKINVQN